MDQVNWLSSKGVRALLRHSVVDEARLRDALWMGAIQAKARRASVRPRHSQRETEYSDWPIPADAWRSDADRTYFSLLYDRFTTRASSTGFTSLECLGLSFNEAQVMEYFEKDGASTKAADAPSPDGAVGGRGGRALDSETWSNFAAAMLAVTYTNDEFVPEWTANKLYDAIAGYAAERGKSVPGKTRVSGALNLALAWARGIGDPKKED